MMMVVTIIPTRRNDGTAVTKRELRRILDGLTEQFGGHTVESQTEGEWIDPQSKSRFRDQGLKVTVACDRERLAEVENAIRKIGRQLGQKAMWCEVRYSDGVRILNCE